MEAARRFNIDLNNSYIIGDRFSDIQAGINAGLKSSILIKSKHKILEHEINLLQYIVMILTKPQNGFLNLITNII